MSFQAGTLIGQYSLIQRLGSGSFATVWLAQHVVTGFNVAIKIVLKKTLDTPEAITRFNREISLLKQIDHPFIAELFEVVENDEAFFLVMEYVAHGNMLEYVNKNGRLPEDRARRYFCQLVSALDYLHNTRFIAHRDLKAENVLLDRYDNIRLIDFGLSNAFTQGSPTLATACGSPAYAAPEMIQGYTYTKSADIWSAGVLLYAMVAGRLPFDDPNVQALLRKVLENEPVYPPMMSHSLVDLLKRMLSKNPENRITINKLREHPWFSQSEYTFIMQFNFHNSSHWRVSETVPNVPTVDKEIVDRMQYFGLNCHDLPISLFQDEYTELTSVYRQFRKDKITEQMKDLMLNMQRMVSYPRYPTPSISGPYSDAPRPSFPAAQVQFPGAVRLPSNRPDEPKRLQRPVQVNVLTRRLSRPAALKRGQPVATGEQPRVSLEVP